MKKSYAAFGFVVFVLCLIMIRGLTAQGEEGSKFNQLMKNAKEFNAEAAGNLSDWELLGRGELEFDEDENAFMLFETPGSAGVTVVSPETYGSDVTVTFMARPTTHASVNVVMLNVSDAGSGGDIVVPENYDGNFGFWTAGTVQNYLFAFHNAAHDRLPFIVKCPGFVTLAEGEKHHVEPGRWQKVEISRKDSILRLKVNGITVIETIDQDSENEIPGGKVCLRLRGTADALASCLFKNVVITEE